MDVQGSLQHSKYKNTHTSQGKILEEISETYDSTSNENEIRGIDTKNIPSIQRSFFSAHQNEDLPRKHLNEVARASSGRERHSLGADSGKAISDIPASHTSVTEGLGEKGRGERENLSTGSHSWVRSYRRSWPFRYPEPEAIRSHLGPCKANRQHSELLPVETSGSVPLMASLGSKSQILPLS